MSTETDGTEKKNKLARLEQELIKAKERTKLLEQQRKEILKADSDKERKLRSRMLIELSALLFGDRYKEAFDAMKKDPDNFKKRVAEFYAGKK
jgi:hypothetical protein